MSRIRFSMASLMAGVALFAITFAGLRAEAAVWPKILSTIIVFVLLVSILCAIYSNGVRRAFWVGFTVGGWGYWLLAYGPLPDATRNGLLAIHLAVNLQPKLQKTVTRTVPAQAAMSSGGSMGMGTMSSGAGAPGMSSMGSMGTGPMSAGAGTSSSGGMMGGNAAIASTIMVSVGPSLDQVVIICHCWLTILFAMTGGLVARYVASRNLRATSCS